jgi:hypothetical protein
MITGGGEKGYNHPVKLAHGDVFTLDEYREMVENATIADEDGYGHPVKDEFFDRNIKILPSKDSIPLSATHVLWFNK